MKRAEKALLKIGELARLMGVRAQTIRSYEQQGLLLKPAVRSKAGHRLYGAYEVAQLRFTRRAKGESKHWVEGCPIASIR